MGDLDVELHFVKEGAVLSKNSRSHEKFIHDIKLAVAKNYCDNLSEEASKGMREKASQGIWPTVAPLGYLNVAQGMRRVIDLDPERAELVADLFRLFATGTYSLKTLAKHAQENGLRSRKNTLLKHSHMHWILTNPVYRGIISWKGEEFPGVHTPLVDDATWYRVQEILTGRTSKASFGDRQYLYRGLFTCGTCGCAITGYTAKGKYVYYACGGFKGCVRKGVREEVLDEAISSALKGLTIRPEVLSLLTQALRESFDEVKDAREPTLNALERERTRLKGRLARSYQDKLDGEIDATTYQELNHRWRTELVGVEQSLIRLQTAEEAYFDENVAMLELVGNSFRTYLLGSNEEKRELLQYLLSNSQIVAGRPVLNFKSWFKLVLVANEEIAQSGREDTDLEIWSG